MTRHWSPSRRSGTPAARRCVLAAVAACVGVLLAASCSGNSSTAPDAPLACTADCECPSFCCNGNQCMECFRPTLGLCGPEGDCACVGGTCDSRHCCVLADGA